VFEGGGTVSEITDLDRPENRDDRRFHRLLEVYTPVTAPDGTTLLYETYVRDAAVSASGRALWSRILPTAIGALLLLELVQLPLALRLARRLGERRAERERLLQAAIDASELERRRIARDLHDGVVQHLAGVRLHLHAAGMERGDVDDATASTMTRAADDVGQAIRELRTLLVDIYPPNLRDVGLEQALRDLVSELPARGIEPVLDFELPGELDPQDEQLLFRVAQEAVRNAERHAGASRLELRVAREGGRLSLAVSDDGAGFDTTAAAPDGHVGLQLLRDLVASAGGELHVRSAPGNGTDVTLELAAGNA
jgi:signal transduction histidine kinase